MLCNKIYADWKDKQDFWKIADHQIVIDPNLQIRTTNSFQNVTNHRNSASGFRYTNDSLHNARKTAYSTRKRADSWCSVDQELVK